MARHLSTKDILKRLANLEKHVFDEKLEEDDDDLDKTRVITPIKD